MYYSEEALRTSKVYGETNTIGVVAIKKDIATIKAKAEICKELISDELKLKGFDFLLLSIDRIVKYNEDLLCYNRNPQFTQEQIAGCIRERLNEWIRKDEESGFISRDDEYPELYHTEIGIIDSNEYSLDESCGSRAYTELEENYMCNHPKGAQIDGELLLLQGQFIGEKNRVELKLNFIKEIQKTNDITKRQKPIRIFDFTTTNCPCDIMDKIRTIRGSRPMEFKGKRVATMIKALEELEFINVGRSGLRKFIIMLENELGICKIPYNSVAGYYFGQDCRNIDQAEINKLKQTLR